MGNLISDGRLYTVTLGDTSLRVMVYPIDTIGQNISPLCNFDFLNFIWDYLPTYSFLKFGIIAFPVQNRTTILYVQHHRARSDGWQSTVLCEPCARRRRAIWYMWFNCTVTAECRCAVCVRQPPSLRASAANVVFNLVLSPEKFRVTRVNPLIIMPMPTIWTRYRFPTCCHASACIAWTTVSIPRVGVITSTIPLPHILPLSSFPIPLHLKSHLTPSTHYVGPGINGGVPRAIARYFTTIHVLRWRSIPFFISKDT
jgi:hypothetical protein